MAETITRTTSTGASITFGPGSTPEHIESVMRGIEAEIARQRQGQNTAMMPVDALSDGQRQNLEALTARGRRRAEADAEAAYWQSLRDMGPMSTGQQAVAIGMRALNSAVGNWGDEIVGTLSGGAHDLFGGSYDEGYRAAEQMLTIPMDRLEATDPNTALAADIGGAFVPFATGARFISRGKSGFGRSARSGLVGTAWGAAAGAGAADSDLSSRLSGAVFGGALGGVAGATLPAALTAAGRGVRAVGRGIGRGLERAEQGLASLNPFSRGKRPSRNPTMEWTHPGGAAQSIDDEAARILSSRMAADEVGGAASGLGRVGRPATSLSQRENAAILDVAGTNVRGLARTLFSLPGPGQTRLSMFFDARRAQTHDRMIDEIMGAIGQDPAKARKAFDDLARLRAEASTPAYEALYRQIGTVSDPRLMEILNDPKTSLAKLLNAVELRLGNERRLNSEGFVVRDGAGRITGMTMRGADYLKQHLDQLIQDAVDHGRKAELFGLQRLQNEYVGLLDELTTVDGTSLYRAARDVYSGPSQTMDALKNGEAMWRRGLPADEIDDVMRSMPEGDRDFYRLGAIRALSDEIARNPNPEKYLSVFNRRRLGALIGDQALTDRLIAGLDTISTSNKTGRFVTGGSSTEPTRRSTDDFLMEAGGNRFVAAGKEAAARVAETGSRLAAIQPFGRLLGQIMREKMYLGPMAANNPRTRAIGARIAEMMTEQDPVKAAQVASRMAALSEAEARRIREFYIRGGGGGQQGKAAGGAAGAYFND